MCVHGIQRVYGVSTGALVRDRTFFGFWTPPKAESGKRYEQFSGGKGPISCGFLVQSFSIHFHPLAVYAPTKQTKRPQNTFKCFCKAIFSLMEKKNNRLFFALFMFSIFYQLNRMVFSFGFCRKTVELFETTYSNLNDEFDCLACCVTSRLPFGPYQPPKNSNFELF